MGKRRSESVRKFVVDASAVAFCVAGENAAFFAFDACKKCNGLIFFAPGDAAEAAATAKRRTQSSAAENGAFKASMQNTPIAVCKECDGIYHQTCIGKLADCDVEKAMRKRPLDDASLFFFTCRPCKILNEHAIQREVCIDCAATFVPTIHNDEDVLFESKSSRRNLRVATFQKETWRCGKCAHCDFCGTRDSRGTGWSKIKGFGVRNAADAESSSLRWHRNNRCCAECFEVMARGQQCAVCRALYSANDCSVPMLMCDGCDAWCHLDCDVSVNGDDYERLTRDEETLYFCPACKLAGGTPSSTPLSTPSQAKIKGRPRLKVEKPLPSVKKEPETHQTAPFSSEEQLKKYLEVEYASLLQEKKGMRQKRQSVGILNSRMKEITQQIKVLECSLAKKGDHQQIHCNADAKVPETSSLLHPQEIHLKPCISTDPKSQVSQTRDTFQKRQEKENCSLNALNVPIDAESPQQMSLQSPLIPHIACMFCGGGFQGEQTLPIHALTYTQPVDNSLQQSRMHLPSLFYHETCLVHATNQCLKPTSRDLADCIVRHLDVCCADCGDLGASAHCTACDARIHVNCACRCDAPPTFHVSTQKQKKGLCQPALAFHDVLRVARRVYGFETSAVFTLKIGDVFAVKRLAADIELHIFAKVWTRRDDRPAFEMHSVSIVSSNTPPKLQPLLRFTFKRKDFLRGSAHKFSQVRLADRSLPTNDPVDGRLPLCITPPSPASNAADLAVATSRIAGVGVFAQRVFACGDAVVEYVGEVIGQAVANKRERWYEARRKGCYMFKVARDTIVDATLIGNKARFINHSCSPNCVTRIVRIGAASSSTLTAARIVIQACRRIEVGEEFAYDYKFPIEDAKLRCSCGAANCIGRMN